MGISSVMQWWEEWQLRILVLSSLFIQYVLFFSIWLRRAPVLRSLRVLVWIAYIGGDAVAIYALATLFNRQKHTSHGETSNLEVLWVPVLLIHLGGQPLISAYSLEDNELWKRHTITVVSQVTVALYVFCKWWSGEKTVLAVAVLLFLVGILKFTQKPWALRSSSFNTMQASSTTVSLPAVQGEHIYSLEEYVQAAKRCVVHAMADSQCKVKAESSCMFVDQSAPYSVRIGNLPTFLGLDKKLAYDTLQRCLIDTCDNLYTRIGSIRTIYGSVVYLLPYLVTISVMVFAASHKDGHNEKDIRTTYILLCGTTVLEFLFPSIVISSRFQCCHSFLKLIDVWHDIVSQHNIMSFCVRKKKPTSLMNLAFFNILREYLNKHWYIQQAPVAYQITGMVRLHVEDGWKNYICNATSYRIFNELRGQRAIRRHHQLGWSLKMPFDESVLTWHIATDLCFYHPNTSLRWREEEITQRSREVSNYMIYLLLINPEMLMPGTRSDLFTLASNDIVENSNGSVDMTEEMLAQEVLSMPILSSSGNMISNARKLAEALVELGDEEETWTVIQGVWVEMLCYSASRCRGYLHAKSLGEGGEYLSYIWLLWAFMGMQTLADRHQMSEPPQEQGEESIEFPFLKQSRSI